MNFLRKYRAHIFITMVVILLLGSFVGFGGYMLSPEGGSPHDAVAEVNGKKITLGQFDSYFNRVLSNLPPGQKLSDDVKKQKQQETIRDLVQAAVVEQEAKRYGVHVTDQEIVSALMQNPNFQDKGVFSPELYGRALQYGLKMSSKDFEREQGQALTLMKLRWLFESVTRVTDKEADMVFQVEGPTFEKAWKTSHPKETVKPETLRGDFRKQLQEVSLTWALNAWFNQAVQKSKIKTHENILAGPR